jgi:hypothetical protein
MKDKLWVTENKGPSHTSHVSVYLHEAKLLLEAYNHSAAQEFPNSLWNSEVPHRVYSSPQFNLILSLMNSVHTDTAYLISILTHTYQWVSKCYFFLHVEANKLAFPSSPTRAKRPEHSILVIIFGE